MLSRLYKAFYTSIRYKLIEEVIMILELFVKNTVKIMNNYSWVNKTHLLTQKVLLKIFHKCKTTTLASKQPV